MIGYLLQTNLFLIAEVEARRKLKHDVRIYLEEREREKEEKVATREAQIKPREDVPRRSPETHIHLAQLEKL
jgi:hypothetical protein